MSDRLLAEFSLYLQIDDHLALAKAAAERAVADGAYDTEDDYIGEVGADELATHLRMLLDPGTLAGCSIMDSAAEINGSFAEANPIDEDTCPDDPDGQHHVGCGCDHEER